MVFFLSVASGIRAAPPAPSVGRAGSFPRPAILHTFYGTSKILPVSYRFVQPGVAPPAPQPWGGGEAPRQPSSSPPPQDWGGLRGGQIRGGALRSTTGGLIAKVEHIPPGLRIAGRGG